MLGCGGENLPYYVALSSIRCYRIEAIVDCLYYSLKLGGGGGPMLRFGAATPPVDRLEPNLPA